MTKGRQGLKGRQGPKDRALLHFAFCILGFVFCIAFFDAVTGFGFIETLGQVAFAPTRAEAVGSPTQSRW